ncbi:MAG: 50S ribosomal protein L2 [Candidatus Harrisonbacteria bacterium RIFCSPLOWO2_02_FULL_41_11]|uniref:Large ribosomal subunit protein uL2 n=1 Tax=Candidatus Harrisonbacteria bacterium RIFCSPHIGHO2_02_FULL_42_16 TaxID=1798404 RepID=A0A1G1ZIW9_9BACT|nr:MAG: 50S ribosomal protein L2 [Candidatus Harrisonbacteria bacterium RIFCSPHIGHO2_02_FULL_42_16]OGY67642.1 MAG: 50S ribosomal protein L2 [Candidatus Harrisonbacteria bacterium RIFCSPLOWO2_02_FULL_41_11]
MKIYKPTSSSRRQMTSVDYGELTANKPHKALTAKVSKSSGRNNQGRITMRHQGGGNKRRYRMVDFRQDKIDISAKIETIEYDPYRTAFIALVIYRDGERRYILASKDLKVGQEIITSEKSVLNTGNRLKLKNIPIGYQVYNVELIPGKGGQLARSAGSYAEVLGQEGKYSVLKLLSGEVRKVPSESYASLGQVSNQDWNLVNIGKAGRSRWLGIRPTVRGKAMNPVDHPYGGGEGSQPRGTKRPKDIWGNITGGRKTRKRKRWSTKLIIQRRPKK